MWMTWMVPERVAASGMISPSDADDLRREGIRSVLSLSERNPFRDGPPDDFHHRHLPVVDMSAPRDDQLRDAVGFIRSEVDSGRPVLVHCAAGFGRTGTVIACYLVSEGVDPDGAIARVRELRPGSVETREQERAVRSFRLVGDSEDG